MSKVYLPMLTDNELVMYVIQCPTPTELEIELVRRLATLLDTTKPQEETVEEEYIDDNDVGRFKAILRRILSD